MIFVIIVRLWPAADYIVSCPLHHDCVRASSALCDNMDYACVVRVHPDDLLRSCEHHGLHLLRFAVNRDP